MASASEELTSLKLRAAKKHGADKITMINHAARPATSLTCTVADGIAILAQVVAKGFGGHVYHILDHAEEKKRKLTNPTNATKKIFNCRTPEQWKLFNAALEPYYEEAVDPHIAIDIIIAVLRSATREQIRGMVQEGHEERDGPPQAEALPGEDWFQRHIPATHIPAEEPMRTDRASENELPDFLKP